jgi:NAD(P)-dependent dehydrogenase (short-subunit alcohol dehydrogenase family)
MHAAAAPAPAAAWLARATGAASLAATAQARLVGGPRVAALVIDVRAPEATLDAAVAQVRALLQRLRQGAITSADFERSQTLRDRWELEASLDPRRRLITLWREPRPPPPAAPLSLEGWRAWVANTLSDEKLVVVEVK